MGLTATMSVLNWRKVRTHLPSKSGKYLVTIHKPTEQGLQIFADLAYYRGHQGKWYSFVRVNNRDMILEEITSTIISFVDEAVETPLTITEGKS